MERHIILLILLFLVQYCTVSISAAPSNETDQEALLAFQSLITSPNHFLANNWTKNTSFCSWFGVTCSSKRPRVVALALPNLQLQGTISPSLANLSFLRELNLENIFFHGDIPYGLGHLPHLRVIDVQNNQLKGNIPTSLFQHWRVQVISLAFNKLSGEMWQGPWYVPELRILNLRNNSLKGIIPPSIGNATKLLNFSLFGNRGNIPKEIGNLSQLAFLNLAVNQLTGFIPSSLFNVSSLLAIALGLNNLSGPLVLDEGNIVSNLESLSISRNQISGHIPSNICQLTELKILSISFNDITGEIPKNIDCLSKLKEFSIGYNPTDGTIPSSLGNISTLQYVYCVSNRLEGPIPPELGKLSNLIQLDFEENYIKGQIPKAIFNISSLKLIALTLNKLSGRIPTSTGLHLPNLEELHLTGNALEGEIPAHITNVTKLKYLGLADNFFSGSIPTNWGNLRDLRLLFLHINQLTSEHELPFFHSLADCRMLEYLDVGNNPLNSILPNSVGNLSSTIKFFEISDAHINGLIPPGIGNVSGLTTLVFQRNNLMGNIPPAIGPIPLSFASLISLEILDLSVNALSGTIPRSLEELLYLKAINVSFNDLEGEIPNGGVFANSTLQSFLGNKDLCGMHKLEVPSCPITNSGEQSKSKELVLKIVIPVLTSSSLIFFLVSIWIMKQKKKGKSKNVEKFWEIKTHQLISYHEIQRATNYFDGSNLLVHCDLKPANILLDEDMVAHVGDFGISKILAVSKSMAHTETLGTLGYMAPEYGSEAIVSTSGDVYSCGIMLMEVLTKRRPTDEEICNENLDLRKWITQSFPGSMMDVVDDNFFPEEEQITSKSEICIDSVIQLALECTKETPESRINMKDVVTSLNKIKITYLGTRI
ncbi:LRR receptor-like serine/threonine-protein kinase EFR [Capsicum annuum]|uniref:LRR receptor-like serine/threonine-protein kinase EFR n=1 Tax=Capsicum annuum TaxID=4072 RepID=UPI001FB1437B|nr:LRR receptor-like serine/threonine-protein kinase EFR [Capsicum annuum]